MPQQELGESTVSNNEVPVAVDQQPSALERYMTGAESALGLVAAGLALARTAQSSWADRPSKLPETHQPSSRIDTVHHIAATAAALTGGVLATRNAWHNFRGNSNSK